MERDTRCDTMVVEPSPDGGIEGRKCFFIEVGEMSSQEGTVYLSQSHVTKGKSPEGCFAVSDILAPFDVMVHGMWSSKN